MSHPGPQAVVLFRNCFVRVWTQDYLETVFPDGGIAPAEFIVSEETKQTAVATGYGDDVRRMHLEHELGHTYLSEHIGRPYSYVLKRVANQEPWTPDPVRAHEEALVLTFQRYLNTLEWDAALCVLGNVEPIANAFRERFAALTVRALSFHASHPDAQYDY